MTSTTPDNPDKPGPTAYIHHKAAPHGPFQTVETNTRESAHGLQIEYFGWRNLKPHDDKPGFYTFRGLNSLSHVQLI